MSDLNQMVGSSMTKQELISSIEKYYLHITIDWANHVHKMGWLKDVIFGYELIEADNEITRGRWYTFRLNQIVNEVMSGEYFNFKLYAKRNAKSALDSLDYKLLWDSNSKLAGTLMDTDTIHTSTTMAETFDRVLPAIRVYKEMEQKYPIKIKIPKGKSLWDDTIPFLKQEQGFSLTDW